MANWKKHVVTFLVAAAGMGCALGAMHAYYDHQALHAIVALIQQNQQAQAKQQQAPRPPVQSPQ